MVCNLCVCLYAWALERKEDGMKGGVVKRKNGDRFVLFFFSSLPTSIYDDEEEEKGKKREKEKMLLLCSCSANDARALAYTRTE